MPGAFKVEEAPKDGYKVGVPVSDLALITKVSDPPINSKRIKSWVNPSHISKFWFAEITLIPAFGSILIV